FHVDLGEAHATLERKCLSILHDSFLSGQDPIELVKLQNTFIEYAALNWVNHLLASNSSLGEDGSFRHTVRSLFPAKDNRSSQWLSLYEAITPEELPRHEVFGPLFGGAYFGLSFLVDEALEEGADIEADDQFGKTALHWASERGYLGIAK